MAGPKNGTKRAALDNCNLNTLADQLKALAFGSLLQGQMPQVRRKLDMVARGASPYGLSTVQAVQLPDSGKASSILRASVRAGGVTGELTAVAYGVTPSTTNIGVAPNGDIVTLGSDAITDLDVSYVPARGDVIEAVFPVVSNAIVLPTVWATRGVIYLLEAESLEGTLVSKLIVLVPAASVATTKAALNVAKTSVVFAAADAVTRARVKLLVTTAEDLNAVLESQATTL